MRSLNILKKGLLGAFGTAVLFTGAAMAHESPRDEWEEWQSAVRELRNEEMEYRRNPTRSNYRGWQDALRDERREYREYQIALARNGGRMDGRFNAGYNDGRFYNEGRT